MIILIGKTLLIILIIMVSIPFAAALLLLFAPVNYIVQAEDRDVTVKFTWLLGFLRITYAKRRLTAKIFWVKTLGKSKGSPRKTKPPKVKTPAKKNKTVKKKDGSVISLSKILAVKDKRLLLKYASTFIKRCVKALKPAVFDLSLLIGFKDPAHTGYLLGFLGIIQGMWGIRMNASGDFDEERFQMRLFVKDTLALWSLAWPLAALCVKRPVWVLIKSKFRKDDTGEHSAESKL